MSKKNKGITQILRFPTKVGLLTVPQLSKHQEIQQHEHHVSSRLTPAFQAPRDIPPAEAGIHSFDSNNNMSSRTSKLSQVCDSCGNIFMADSLLGSGGLQDIIYKLSGGTLFPSHWIHFGFSFGDLSIWCDWSWNPM